jgi:hypothetical protein
VGRLELPGVPVRGIVERAILTARPEPDAVALPDVRDVHREETETPGAGTSATREGRKLVGMTARHRDRRGQTMTVTGRPPGVVKVETPGVIGQTSG